MKKQQTLKAKIVVLALISLIPLSVIACAIIFSPDDSNWWIIGLCLLFLTVITGAIREEWKNLNNHKDNHKELKI